jgi:uncharacterized protein (DUF924 family)
VDPEPVEGRLVSAPEEAAEIVEFWFSPECRKRWFQSTLAFDRLLRERYLASYEAARDGKLGRWEQSAVGALALVILLDQIPLNIFRDDARCFATEAEARSVAQRALARGLDRQLGDDQKSFLYSQNRGHDQPFTNPEKPINASDIRPAVTSAIAAP